MLHRSVFQMSVLLHWQKRRSRLAAAPHRAGADFDPAVPDRLLHIFDFPPFPSHQVIPPDWKTL
jgi:hypothetical protein